MPGTTSQGPSNVVVFDIGGTWFRSGVWTAAGELVGTSRVPAVSFRRHPDASAQELHEGLLAHLCRESSRLAAAHGPCVRAVISMGAALDAHTGQVFGSGPLWGPRSAPLDLGLAIRRRAPTLEWHVLNDVTAMLLRHVVQHGARSHGRMALVTISTGIASRTFDFVRRCVPVDPVHGLQGEIGHLPVACTFRGVPIHLQCDCGGRDHLNAFASGSGLDALVRHLAATTDGPFRNGPVGVGALLAAAAAGEPWSCSVLEAAFEPLVGILCVMLTQDPELDPVVLVGGIAATLGDRLSTMLLEALERHGMYEVTTRDPGWFRRRIRLGALDDDSGLIGCGVFAHGFAGGPGAFA